MRYMVGIDEAGRAPLAGPVSVGLVMVPKRFDVAREFPGVRDSKKLSRKKREEIYELLRRRQEKGDVQFCVRFSSHVRIDEVGITRAVRRALELGLRYLTSDVGDRISHIHVQMDGLLHAPPEYSQETIIHGDDLVPLISLASVAAKVERDRFMYRMAKKFPQYGFEQHVGYPTEMHRQAILEHGLSAIHRHSFCKKWVPVG